MHQKAPVDADAGIFVEVPLECNVGQVFLFDFRRALDITSQHTCVPLDEIIDHLPFALPNHVHRTEVGKQLKDVRNALIHEGKMPSINVRRMLIAEVLQLERDLLGRPVLAKAVEGCVDRVQR